MSITQDWQKSYVRYRNLEFGVGDKVIFVYGKSRPSFIGPFNILDRIEQVHNIFHMSMLRKYLTDSTHMIDYKPLQINEPILCLCL